MPAEAGIFKNSVGAGSWRPTGAVTTSPTATATGATSGRSAGNSEHGNVGSTFNRCCNGENLCRLFRIAHSSCNRFQRSSDNCNVYAARQPGRRKGAREIAQCRVGLFSRQTGKAGDKCVNRSKASSLGGICCRTGGQNGRGINRLRIAWRHCGRRQKCGYRRRLNKFQHIASPPGVECTVPISVIREGNSRVNNHHLACRCQ